MNFRHGNTSENDEKCWFLLYNAVSLNHFNPIGIDIFQLLCMLISREMQKISRNSFLKSTGLASLAILIEPGLGQLIELDSEPMHGVSLSEPMPGEDIFSYINRISGGFDLSLYRKILGAANAFKEGDQAIGVAAADETSREFARSLLANTLLSDLSSKEVFTDGISELIKSTTIKNPELLRMTMAGLKNFVLEKEEAEIRKMMPALSSDHIACLVKLMTNDELIHLSRKVFNPLAGSQIGSKGYLSARIQPNSPTDDVEDIQWQVFNAWSFAVGDLVLGTNPVSSDVSSVAGIEAALFDIIATFGLQDTIPNCVLSHIDIQAEVEELQPGTTGIWFQSLAGTVNANATFGLTIAKMQKYAASRSGRYGLYCETGQGADYTNGHGEGFDMVMHESRKYGFLRALKQQMEASANGHQPWVFVNDVAGFIGPEVFRTREQLVRCCLEDTVMGKLHGLTIGLDICSTLHMDVTLDDLDWCIEQVMPANPAYLMALPTKNDPMLSYLTTAFNNHVKIRQQFGYKVNDAMWKFFIQLGVIGDDGKPGPHFGDPLWVYTQYRLTKEADADISAIRSEGLACLERIRQRGVPIVQGHGKNHWDLPDEVDKEVHRLYEDAKISLWSELSASFITAVPGVLPLFSQSTDRIDYVYHPPTGEHLSLGSEAKLRKLQQQWKQSTPDIQLIISDGLNARAIMDEGHLGPFMKKLKTELNSLGLIVSKETLVITTGRVRAGYACGEQLFGNLKAADQRKGIIHIIGERPGSGHHNFSAYITFASPSVWAQKGRVDHDITRVVSGISDTALNPELAALETVSIVKRLLKL